MVIPFASLTKDPPRDGQIWRMNFARTYHGYFWSAWKAGTLNDARTGGNVIFDSNAPAVRLLSVDSVTNGRVGVSFEVANATPLPQTVELSIACEGEQELGKGRTLIGQDSRAVTVAPGKTEIVLLGRGQRLPFFNRIHLEANTRDGKPLLRMVRTLHLPAPRFGKKPAPEKQLVYVFPRFLPSLDRLAVNVDYTAWAKKTGHTGTPPVAEIQVWRKGQEKKKAILSGTLSNFIKCKGVWRVSTAKLPEGEYSVNVRVIAGNGQVIANESDWFEKRIFDWMVHKRGIGKEVPAPYLPVSVKKSDVQIWGRSYRFAPNGLPTQIVSQGKPLLKEPVQLHVISRGKKLEVKTQKSLSFTICEPSIATAKSVLQAANLRVLLESHTEYDGFTLFRLQYGPIAGSLPLDATRLRVPLDVRYTKFYSAAGDPLGVQVLGDVVPDRQGKILDSLNDLRSVCCSPTFATLFWVGDHETCFCYAADCDKGWILSDAVPAMEVIRKGDTLELWLNFVNRPATLSFSRTLEFAFQAGPVKPLPDGWRGIQQDGIVGDCPTTLIQVGGSGNTMCGGTHFIHPGVTPELRRKSRETLAKVTAGGNKAVVGYHYWGTVPKGFSETRVFRGEWGLDRHAWEAATEVRKWEWDNRFYGDDKDLYIITYIHPVPSYVDFITYAYDEALKETPITGFYDDTGYPKPVFDPELGLGYVREDGREIYSSGLWIYRERWKRAAYLNWKHGRPNYLGDSQHCGAHYMPAYGFIGRWAPCEHGYYNPFPDRDNLGFYHSMERYVAFNPGRQFGQIPNMIGMSTPQWEFSRASRDTRCMMMLAMLNDQDVGSFGYRDMWTVCSLRHARNLFRPWEKDVDFIGYWKSPDVLRCDTKDVLVSVYLSPRGALFLVGNTSSDPRFARIEPEWEKLALIPQSLKAFDAESGAEAPFDGTFRVDVPPHDLRIILVSPSGSFPVIREKPGKHLPVPRTIVAELSDAFSGSTLSPGWQKDLHEGRASVGIIDGRLYLQGASYGYAHIRRDFGVDNVAVQCLIARAGSGCADVWGGSLILVWPNGAFVQATPGTSEGRFTYLVSGSGVLKGQSINTAQLPGWYPTLPNWVKIVLKPDCLEFHSSTDGKTWVRDQVTQRGANHAGAPQYLLLGNGGPGEKPHFDNVLSQHFNPDSPVTTFFANLVVGSVD